MSISLQQKDQVIKCFNLLVKHFIKDKSLHAKIQVLFQEQSIEGVSFYENGNYYSCFWDKDFKSLEFLFEVVSHEFTHVYFLVIEGYHSHNDRFFSYAEFFLAWLKGKINSET